MRNLFVAFCFIMLFFVLLGLPVNSLMAFVIMLMSLSFRQGNIKANIILFLIYAIVFTYYAIFSWSGFGRTVVIGWLILAALQLAYSLNIKVNKYLFGIVPGLAASLLSSRDLLELKFSGFKNALYDSAYGPYRFASSLLDNFNEHGIDFPGFIDQIIFTFFVFVPRKIWTDKPYGFGFEYTVRHLDAYLADAGHSVAATLIGEHIYYLGYIGIISALIIFTIIAWIANLLYKIKGLNGNAIIIFSASMMVLVWGGMTSFSARVVLPILVFILLFTLLRRFLTRRIKFIFRTR